jgi:hypothetical protein
VEHVSEMKALTFKAVFASLNPSPVFEVVAMLAEGLVLNGDESRSKEIAGASDLALPESVSLCDAKGQMCERAALIR